MINSSYSYTNWEQFPGEILNVSFKKLAEEESDGRISLEVAEGQSEQNV